VRCNRFRERKPEVWVMTELKEKIKGFAKRALKGKYNYCIEERDNVVILHAYKRGPK